MKYTNEITIDLPRSRVIELFDDPKNLYEWMDGLQSFEPISGTPGSPGAQSRLVFKMGKRDTEMIETITKRDLPYEFHAIYETKGVRNIQENYFEENDQGQTTWITHTEFQFDGIFMKIVGFLMPGAFKKQTRKFMENFKAFAERQAA